MPAPETTPLPIAGEEGRERADAARNRRLILDAAAHLFAERGVDGVSMDDVAREAGVGKGTLFRRFGDRSGLARAVLSTREAAFQEGVLRGPPPLGPGAPAVERLVAFGRGMLGFVDAHRQLLLAAETGSPCSRFRSEPYTSYHLYVRLLVADAAPGLDPDYTADALLATLSAELITHLRDDRQTELEQIADGYEALVRRLVRHDP